MHGSREERCRHVPSLPAALGVSLVVLVLAACSSPEPDTRANELAALALSADPVLEIGVLEGDEDYIFQDIVSTFHLSSGNLIVADGGASHLSTFTPAGDLIRRWGGRGEGPGEFRAIGRARALGADSIWVSDGWTGRLSLFDTAGSFSHQTDARDLSGDSLFRLDVWLYGRFWVDGALAPGARAAVRSALARIPPPVEGPGYREVRVADGGDLWMPEPGVSADGLRTWVVFSADGTPRSMIDMPRRFDPQEIGPAHVTGRWLGPSDVHFVRTYSVSSTGSTREAPAWLLPHEEPRAADVPDATAFETETRGAIRAMAVAEEIHYAGHGTYTARLDSLDVEDDLGSIVIDVLAANARGWSGVFTHPALDHICGLRYGAVGPPGWPAGTVVCGPPITRAAGK